MLDRGISIESHASTDVVLVIALLALPSAFGFAGLNTATVFTWGAALLGLLMYLISRQPIGVWPLLPMRWHARLDYAAALALLTLPPLVFPEQPGLAWGGPVLGLLSMLSNRLTRYPRD